MENILAHYEISYCTFVNKNQNPTITYSKDQIYFIYEPATKKTFYIASNLREKSLRITQGQCVNFVNVKKRIN